MRADMFVYRVLTGVPREVFEQIDGSLVQLGVSGSYSEMRTGGRIYRVPICETDVLPNRNGPTLPVGMRKNAVTFQLGKLPDRATEGWPTHLHVRSG